MHLRLSLRKLEFELHGFGVFEVCLLVYAHLIIFTCILRNINIKLLNYYYQFYATVSPTLQ